MKLAKAIVTTALVFVRTAPTVVTSLHTTTGVAPQAQLFTSNDEAPAYRDALVALHKSLVEISSLTYNEHDVGQWLLDFFREHDFETEAQLLPTANGTVSSQDNDGTYGKGSKRSYDESNDETHQSQGKYTDEKQNPKPRFNVIAWPGPDKQPSPKVLVTSHIDTVPPHISYSRSNNDEDDDSSLTSETVIAGRGSVDAKACVAAQIIAVMSLLESGEIEKGDVLMLYVIGEERTGDGMRFFSDSLPSSSDPQEESSHQPGFSNLRAAIFGEPTESKLACGHKGIFDCVVTAHGRAGHSGYPWLFRSATELLIRGLVKIFDTDLGSSEQFGNTTVNVGMIEGGVAPNVIPENATATLSGRVGIGPEAEGGNIVVERVRSVLGSVGGDEEAFDMSCDGGYGVVETACDVPGFDTVTVNYGTDVPNLKGNRTRYLYGPGSILVAHGPDEAIRLGDLETGVEDFKKLILHAVQAANKEGR